MLFNLLTWKRLKYMGNFANKEFLKITLKHNDSFP